MARPEEEELSRRFVHRLVAFGRRRTRSEQDAWDLAQETLLLSLEKLRAGAVREPEKIGSFILGVARTLLLSSRRRELRSESIEEKPGLLPAVSASLRDPLAIDRMVSCLENLKERDRAVVLLSFYGQETSAEVADSLGLSRSNVRVIRHRSVSRLRDCLREDERSLGSVGAQA